MCDNTVCNNKVGCGDLIEGFCIKILFVAASMLTEVHPLLHNYHGIPMDYGEYLLTKFLDSKFTVTECFQ